jgi:hypothetical protein
MRRQLYILFALFLSISCKTRINSIYFSTKNPIFYTVNDYPLIIDTSANTQAFKRDTVGIERIITYQIPPEEVEFKWNRTCVYSFISNGSDSGPIQYQHKGKYVQNGDSISVNFTEIRSIGQNVKLSTNMRIEDREWRNLRLYESIYFLSNKRDTMWRIDRENVRGFDYIK